MKFRMIHENFNVSDLDVSLAFYEKALGLKELRRKTAEDGSFIIVYDLAFRADDFEAAHALHEEMGCIAFENHDMGIYFITDPDGYWLEILPPRD